MDSSPRSPVRFRLDLLPLVLVLTVSATTWYWVPSMGFTGIDTGPLLLANRIAGPASVLAPFVQEVRDGIEPGVAFYRPWTGLSYGIDLAIYGLRASYFHLVDIGIHLGSTGLLFLLLRRLGAGVFAASLGALWFGAHPLGVEVIPATARRADLWAVLWLLLACVGAARWERSSTRTLALIPVLVGGVLAPLSKEIGFALPILLLALAPSRSRLRWLILGLLLVTPAALGRWLVLDGAGGYGGLTLSLSELPRSAIDLLDPARLTGRWGARLLALSVGLWCLYIVALRGSMARLVRFGVLWCALMLGAAALARGVSAWYLYAPLPGAACLLSAMLGRARPLESLRPRLLRIGLVLVLVVAAAFSVPMASPHNEWREVSRQTQRWLFALQRVPEDIFEGEHLIAGIPFQVSFRSDRAVRTRSAGCLMDFSLRAWSELLNGRQPDITSAAYVDVDAPFTHYIVAVSRRPWEDGARIQAFGNVRVRPAPDSSYFELEELRWDQLVVRDVERPLWRWTGFSLQRVPGGKETEPGNDAPGS